VTEDWSYDAENSALPSQYYCFYCTFFNQINAALVRIKDF